MGWMALAPKSAVQRSALERSTLKQSLVQRLALKPLAVERGLRDGLLRELAGQGWGG